MKQDKNGECRVCGQEYQIIDNCSCIEPCSCGPVYQECPECKFNHGYEKDIFKIIQGNLKVKFFSPMSLSDIYNGKGRFHLPRQTWEAHNFLWEIRTDDLISRLDEFVSGIWPKPRDKKEIKFDGLHKQECKSCQTIYRGFKEITARHSEGVFTCPNCFYHVSLWDIPDILYYRASMEIDAKGSINFNVKELSDLVVGELVKYWPKPQKAKTLEHA